MENNSNPIDVQKYLKGVEYPASKTELMEAAQTNSAPEDVIAVLDALEDDAQFENAEEVRDALEDDDDEEEQGAGAAAEEGEEDDTDSEEDDDEEDEGDTSNADEEAA